MTEVIDVIDAGIGNVASVANMFKKIGVDARLVSDPAEVRKSRRLVLPGVGAFDAGMASLRENQIDEAVQAAADNGARILGVCLGMQLLLDRSEEGRTPGLGLISGEVRRFRLTDPSLKVPHMGWNSIRPVRKSFLFAPDDVQQRFYFVHSYHVVCGNPGDETAVANYGAEFTCAIERGNIMGVQFHPEKSHRFGMALLKRFASQ